MTVIEPVLDPRLGAVMVIIASLEACLGVFLLLQKRKNRYPVVQAALICFFASAWVLDSVLADRTATPLILQYSAKLTYVFPILGLITFLEFVLAYPPSDSGLKKSVIRIVSCIVLGAVSVLSLSQTLLTFELIGGRVYTAIRSAFAHQFVLALYLGMVVVASFLLSSKWKRLRSQDKKGVLLILITFGLTAIVGVLFSFLNSMQEQPGTLYLFSYSSTVVFIAGLAYSILRYGSFDLNLTYARKILVATAVLACLVASLLFF